MTNNQLTTEQKRIIKWRRMRNALASKILEDDKRVTREEALRLATAAMEQRETLREPT